MADIKTQVMQAMRELPAMPVVVQKLFEVMNDQSSSLDDVTRVLASDQALAGKVLKLVNSPFYGVSGEVATISRAALVMGYSGLRSVATGFGMGAALAKIGGSHTLAEFWSHSITTAAAAQVVAEKRGEEGPDPEEAFVAGLLHDVGHIVLAGAVPEAYAEAQAAAARAAEPLLVERSILSLDHALIGQKLLEYWKLPEVLQDAARRHHSVEICGGGSQPLTTVVAAADILARMHGSAWEPSPGEAAAGRILLDACRITEGDLDDLLAGVAARVAETSDFVRLAGAKAAPTGPGAAPVAGPVVVISFEERRVRWVNATLRRAGHRLVPVRELLAGDAGAQDVQLVVLDATGLTREKLAKLLAFLRTRPVVVCVLDTGDPAGPATADLLSDFERLPYVFSPTDVARVLAATVTR